MLAVLESIYNTIEVEDKHLEDDDHRYPPESPRSLSKSSPPTTPFIHIGKSSRIRVQKKNSVTIYWPCFLASGTFQSSVSFSIPFINIDKFILEPLSTPF